jgi:O-antigen/teichoic acid export membrane protein
MRLLVRGRASAGVAANGAGLLINIVMQIVSVPVYLHAFGTTRYGEWLALTALPAYLSLTDLGFASVSATQATRQYAVGQIDAARSTMRGAWLLVTIASSVCLVGITILVYIVPIKAILQLREINPTGAQAILALFTLYILISVQSSFVEGSFRAAGRFPLGITISNALRVVEFIIAGTTAIATSSPVATAAALLAARVLGQAVYLVLLWRLVPAMTLGLQSARLGAAARELALPGLAFLSFPLGNALAVQGMVIVTAGVLGAEAVVTLNLVRMLANFVRQLANVVNLGVLPELTAALARNEGARVWRIVNRSMGLTVATCASASLVISAWGSTAIRLWTNDRVDASPFFVLLMCCTVLADVPWLGWSQLLIARNEHRSIGLLYAGACLAAVLLARLLLPIIGLTAIPLALFLTDIVLYLPTGRGAARVTGRTFTSFLIGLGRGLLPWRSSSVEGRI